MKKRCHASTSGGSVAGEALAYFGELPMEQILKLIAQSDGASAKVGWNRDSMSAAFLLGVGAGGEASEPGTTSPSKRHRLRGRFARTAMSSGIGLVVAAIAAGAKGGPALDHGTRGPTIKVEDR